MRPPATLDRLPAGTSATVLEVGSGHALELRREGILAGTTVRVRTVAPLGGPVIVEVGGATVAVARRVAASVEVAVS